MDSDDTPATDAPEAPEPVPQRGPNKKLGYGIAGGIVALMLGAFIANQVQANPPPAKTLGNGISSSPSASYWSSPTTTYAQSFSTASDSAISKTLVCNNPGKPATVTLTAGGAGSVIFTKWTNLPQDLKAGPMGLYIALSGPAKSWQLGQKLYANKVTEQFVFDFGQSENIYQQWNEPGEAAFQRVFGWGVTPSINATITDTTSDLYQCH